MYWKKVSDDAVYCETENWQILVDSVWDQIEQNDLQ